MIAKMDQTLQAILDDAQSCVDKAQICLEEVGDAMEESKKVTEGKELKVWLQPLALFSLAPHLLLCLSCMSACLASVHNWSSWQIKELEQLLATEQQSFHDKDTAATQQIEKLKETWEGAEQKLPDLLKQEFERGKNEGESEENKKQTAILHTNTEHASKHLQSVLDDQNNKLKVSRSLD